MHAEHSRYENLFLLGWETAWALPSTSCRGRCLSFYTCYSVMFLLLHEDYKYHYRVSFNMFLCTCQFKGTFISAFLCQFKRSPLLQIRENVVYYVTVWSTMDKKKIMCSWSHRTTSCSLTISGGVLHFKTQCTTSRMWDADVALTQWLWIIHRAELSVTYLSTVTT